VSRRRAGVSSLDCLHGRRLDRQDDRRGRLPAAAARGLVYRQAGRALPIAQADALYAGLRATPFASVYGSADWYDDLAELVALHHWTQVLRQPFRLVVRDGEALVTSYEPMKSPQARAFTHVERFYRPSP